MFPRYFLGHKQVLSQRSREAQARKIPEWNFMARFILFSSPSAGFVTTHAGTAHLPVFAKAFGAPYPILRDKRVLSHRSREAQARKIPEWNFMARPILFSSG